MSLVNTKYPNGEGYRRVRMPQVNINDELLRLGVYRFDFLNLDVEGAEEEILNSFKFELFQPAIIAVEIHGNHVLNALGGEIATLILSKGYRCVGCAVITYFFVKEELVIS